MKRCTKCGVEKEVTEFYVNKATIDGLESNCKDCKKLQSAIQYSLNEHAKRLYEWCDLPVPRPAMPQYDASCIKILSNQEVLAEMPWIRAQSLANEYNKPLDFIERGLEACELAGVTPNYFIDRYLKGDKTIPVNESVAYQSKLLQDRDYNRGRSDEI
jgi:hypothetical protein